MSRSLCSYAKWSDANCNSLANQSASSYDVPKCNMDVILCGGGGICGISKNSFVAISDDLPFSMVLVNVGIYILSSTCIVSVVVTSSCSIQTSLVNFLFFFFVWFWWFHRLFSLGWFLVNNIRCYLLTLCVFLLSYVDLLWSRSTFLFQRGWLCCSYFFLQLNLFLLSPGRLSFDNGLLVLCS